MGKTVIDPIVDLDFHRIEAALLPLGLYVVRLWDGKGWKSGRFVVK
jgi:hypothetical protein